MKMQTVPLCELGEIVSGSTPRTGVPEFWDGDIPWITPADLSNHDGIYFHGTPKKISKAGFESCSAAMLPAGSILFSSRAPIGHCAVTVYRVCTNQGFKNIVPNKRLDPVYGYFALKFLTPAIVAMGRGATFAEINKELIESVQIPYCDLSEQRRIAERLEQADRLVRTRRYALELTDTFLPATFRQLFGARLKAGPFREFGELVKITGGGTPARERPEFYRGQIPWLTSKDMKGDYIWDTEEHITERAIQESATNLVPAGSILVVVKSKVLMHRLPVAIAKVPLCHGQDIKSIQCSETLQPAFARFVLKFHEGRLLSLARGANTEGLTLPMLEELPVPTVPPSEQEHFAKLVTRHEGLRAVQWEALRQAEHLFVSLLQRAFSDTR
jgi:type I restriction enzyme S subunit